MKMRIPAILIGCGLLTFSAHAETLTEFVSADGSKRMKAKITNVDTSRKTISLLTSTGQPITAPLSAFSADATEKAREFLQLQEIGRKLGFYFEESKGEVNEKKIPAKGQAVLTTPVGYDLKVRNNGTAPMEGVTLKYQVFYSEDIVNGGRDSKVQPGEFTLGSLAPRAEETLASTQVSIVRMKKLPSSECAGGS